ncbi:hypothetical protein F4804DRAFT_25596 [Jackrogersella minutella]|nr:hypothetical protein F4804DRAFT_25596 [Jackrogersella minutella]
MSSTSEKPVVDCQGSVGGDTNMVDADTPPHGGPVTKDASTQTPSVGDSKDRVETSSASTSGPLKRKRCQPENVEDAPPAKKNHPLPVRQRKQKPHGIPHIFERPVYHYDPTDNSGIPDDVDADLDDLVKGDPNALYNHPWADCPGILEQVKEEPEELIRAGLAGIYEDTAEGLSFMAETYASEEMQSSEDEDEDIFS